MTETLDLQQLRANADAAHQLLKTLANSDRLMLLCQLSQGEYSVGELEAMLGISQPTLSQQLAVLRHQRCNVGQGYLFDKPIPSRELIERLRRYQPRTPG